MLVPKVLMIESSGRAIYFTVLHNIVDFSGHIIGLSIRYVVCLNCLHNISMIANILTIYAVF